MKTLCAWCGCVIKPGPPESVSHGICRDCHSVESKRLDEKLGPAKPPKPGKPFTPPPPEFDWLAFLQGQLSLSLALGCAFFLVLLAAEGLHWATGGITPSLIQRIVNADLPHSHHTGRGGW